MSYPQFESWVAFYKNLKRLNLDGEDTITIDLPLRNKYDAPEIKTHSVLEVKTKALEELLQAMPDKKRYVGFTNGQGIRRLDITLKLLVPPAINGANYLRY